LDEGGHGGVGVISVNWYESYDGKREPRLARALRTVSKDFAVVRGSERLVRDFDGVHSLPAVYVFDAERRSRPARPLSTDPRTARPRVRKYEVTSRGACRREFFL
jgi:hypothetical protein